jgi:hypothetical protein
MAIRKKATTKKTHLDCTIDAHVNEVLTKLIEREPRLKAVLSHSISRANEPTDIADHTVQIYRQRLRKGG